MRLAALDFETDPFLHGRKPEPFACGLYDGEAYVDFWGDDVVNQIVGYLLGLDEPHIVYAHNGGKFDFIFLMPHLRGKIKIVNGRILAAPLGECELRDSWGIIPEPLKKAGEKLDIDYAKMERDVREHHKEEIRRYLKQDCVALYDLVDAFIKEFGTQLTIGGVAMKEIKKRHDFDAANQQFDDDFRPFYFGGRCQVLEPGVHQGKFIMVDINSAYGYAMARIEHPVGISCGESKVFSSKTDFAIIRAKNYGALPIKTKVGITFDSVDGAEHEKYGRVFFATRHEIEAGLDTGTLDLIEVVKSYEFPKRGTFADFIEHFTAEKIEAEKRGDRIHRDFYKRVGNSGYGKFAQNAADFRDYMIGDIGDGKPCLRIDRGEQPIECGKCSELANCWTPESMEGDYVIWSKPSNVKTFYNIATAASITGATRSVLLRGLAAADRPMYCDTDSIICEAFHGDIDATRLGAWKLETLAELGKPKGEGKTFDHATLCAIAGKKLYVMFNGDVAVKKAHKGGKLDPKQILEIAQGKAIAYKNDAPTFKPDGTHTFIHRVFRATAVKGRFGKES